MTANLNFCIGDMGTARRTFSGRRGGGGGREGIVRYERRTYVLRARRKSRTVYVTVALGAALKGDPRSRHRS